MPISAMRLLTLAIALWVSAMAFAQRTASAPGSFLIFFDWSKPDINRDAETALEEVARAYDQTRAPRVIVIGHSDRSGPAGVNLRASRRRAEAVRDRLVASGVPSQIITIEAFGEARPVVHTEDGVREAQNRRVEILLVPAS